jgi:hypothetical protein
MTKEILEAGINTLNDILSFESPPNIGAIPSEIVVLASGRSGVSPTRAANKVLEKKKELGIPTGNLPDGSPNDDDILWITAIEAILHEIIHEAKITTGILPGTQMTAAGGNAGGPVSVYGISTTFAKGSTIIE